MLLSKLSASGKKETRSKTWILLYALLTSRTSSFIADCCRSRAPAGERERERERESEQDDGRADRLGPKAGHGHLRDDVRQRLSHEHCLFKESDLQERAKQPRPKCC